MLTKFCLALVMTVSLVGAPKPKKLTRQQIIQSCVTPLSFQERAAFNATKTPLEAAQLLQSLYQERLTYWERRCLLLGVEFRTDTYWTEEMLNEPAGKSDTWAVPIKNARKFEEALALTTLLVEALDKK